MSLKEIFINEMDAKPCFFCKFTTPKTCQNCKDEIECFISNLSMVKELKKAKEQLASITTDYVFLVEPTKNFLRKTVTIEDTTGNDVSFIDNVESYIKNAIYSDGQSNKNVYYFLIKKNIDKENEETNIKQIANLRQIEREIQNNSSSENVSFVKTISDLFNVIDAYNRKEYEKKDEKLRQKGRFLRIIYILDTLKEDFPYKEYKRAVDLFKSGKRNYEAVVSNFLFVNPRITEEEKVVQFKQSAYYGQLTDVPLDNIYFDPNNELTFLWRINAYTENELEKMSETILNTSVKYLFENKKVEDFLAKFDEGFGEIKKRFCTLVKDIHFFEFCEDYSLSKVVKDKVQKYFPGFKIPENSFENIIKLFNDDCCKEIFHMIQEHKKYIDNCKKIINTTDEQLFTKITRKNSEFWIKKITFLKNQLKEWNMFCDKINNIDTLVNQVNGIITDYAKEVEKY